jgi:putative DNA methylase
MTDDNPMQKRKLIEVSLPLEAINRESARENYIYKRNPSSIHKWWAQRPLATARAVLFAQVVDDPSSRPEEFPTEELQRKERDRLHRLVERLVVWENSRDKKLFAEAYTEILKSTGGNPPSILDPFAGGGTIPLEAQRLGLKAHASDLNPVAVLINKALIEIPPKFGDLPPIFPGLVDSQIRQWEGAEGLAADVRAYGEWVRNEVDKRIGHLYPRATLPDGTKAPVLAWIWARTVMCPNPACAITMPLARSWWLGKKKGKESYVIPSVVNGKVHFTIGHDPKRAPSADTDGTVGRTGAKCVGCNAAVELKYIRAEGQAGRMDVQLMAVVAEGARTRVYLEPTAAHQAAALVQRPSDVPAGEIPPQAPSFRVRAYGFSEYVDLFTARQLTALTTFSDIIIESHARILADARSAGMGERSQLAAGIASSDDYADAVTTYLGMAVSKTADYSCSLAVWDPLNDRPKNLFAAQSIPMVWDFPEQNPLTDIGGSLHASLRIISEAFQDLGKGPEAVVTQRDAKDAVAVQGLITTDPPYYDNIGYSDLSDFFYVWLRRTLRPVYPELFSTMLVPKAEELVANSYRHNGKAGARIFFEDGFREVFKRARECALPDFPIVVYYAFKQTETDEAGGTSTGWETLLQGMIGSGWSVTATWPMRSERGSRRISIGTNALASSIVLTLRPRRANAPRIDRRQFIADLEDELPGALKNLQQGAIAPVDLPQAAIGPGMEVFSRYSAVLEADGSFMTVRSALARINEILDQVLNEQEGDFDSTSRFAIAWYRQYGYGRGKFGDADNLARARNTSVDVMDRDGILTSRAGHVKLIKPADLAAEYDVLADTHTSNWEALHHLIRVLESDGITPAGDFLRTALSRPDGAIEPDLVKELAHLLFRIAESNGWTKDALSFNSLVTSWPEIFDAVGNTGSNTATQSSFDFHEDTDS